jgi:hypothetical protein
MFIPKKIDLNSVSYQAHSVDDKRCYQPSQVLCTIYGTFVITEPVLLDLLSSHSVQRLRKINQYGADFFVGTKKRFTRYDHSIGVLCLLRKVNASLLEQIAGLLHDVSHTVFSHTGEIVYNHHSLTGSYQDDIHEWFLQQTEIPEILKKHGILITDILHKNAEFTALEQDLPELCADRLDYNMFGAVIDLLLQPEEISTIVADLHFAHGRWFFTDVALAKKLAMIPLHLTEFHFGSAYDLLINRYTGELLKYGLSIGLLSDHVIHFSCDEDVWHILSNSSDKTIQFLLHRLKNTFKVTLGDETHYDMWLPSKSRGIDPWILRDDVYVRLSHLDNEFKQEFLRVKALLQHGWYIIVS